MLPREIRLDVYEALMRYALDKIEPEGLNCYQTSSFMLVRPILDSAWEKAEAGQKGGSKPKAKRKQIESKGEKEKEEEEEIENEIETEIEDERLRASFEEFWNLYPVKVGKETAFQVWLRLRPKTQAVCDGVKQWLQTEQWIEDKGRFIPRAAKFLEERHYEHLPADHIPKGASGTLGQAELEAIAKVMAE